MKRFQLVLEHLDAIGVIKPDEHELVYGVLSKVPESWGDFKDVLFGGDDNLTLADLEKECQPTFRAESIQECRDTFRREDRE